MPINKKKHDADRYQLLVVVSQQESSLGYRLLDMRREYPALRKELACRVVAGNPALAGCQWWLRLGLEGIDTSTPSVLFEAHLDGDNIRSRYSEPVAVMRVRTSNFAWIAAQIAAKLHVQGTYSYSIAIPEPNSAIVAECNTAQNDIFEIIEKTRPRLVLPTGFSPHLPSPRQTIDEADTWLRCVFRKRAFSEFLAAAAKENSRERSWLGLGSVHLEQNACYVIIEQELELPGEGGKTWMTTHGRDWVRLHDQVGDRLVGYLHLHPRWAGEKEVTPFPSSEDHVVAWNVDRACARPLVFPIAMFGADLNSASSYVKVHGFERGLLNRIQLEVET